MWETLRNSADWDCCRTLILQEILKTKNLLQVEHYAFLEVHTFVPISWMCKKQTSVSHSSTESDIISLDAGLRMDGIHPLDLWDLVIQVFHSSSNQFPKPKESVQGDLLRDTSSSDGNKRTKSNNETTCREPTELPWIGCLTESTWTPKSKSNLLTPNTNSLTC